MAKNEDVSVDLTRTGEAHVPHAKYEKLIASAKQVQRVVTTGRSGEEVRDKLMEC